MLIVRAPQVSVNDEDVLVREWSKADGAQVRVGDLVGYLETSKATFDLEAEADGYFRPAVPAGTRVRVGGIVFVLTDTAAESIESLLAEERAAQPAKKEESSEVRRWTKKAELLAAKYGVNIADVPAVGVVREADVEQFVLTRVPAAQVKDLIDDVYKTNRAERVLIVGGGRGAVQVLDVLWRAGRQRPVAIVDDSPEMIGKQIMGLKVIGTLAEVPDLLKEGVFDAAVISFSNALEARAKAFEKLSAAGVRFTNAIDPSVQVHMNVSIGTGNVVIANSRLGACAMVGNNNFLSAYTNLEHHNVLGSHCTFGPGVMTSSRVMIGDKIRLGTGVFIEPGVKIGSESIIASGSIITADVPTKSIVKAKTGSVVRRR